MKRILFLCVVFVHILCNGQVLPDSVFHTEFRYQVKQLDEFMTRFNGEEALDLVIADSLKKQVNLLYLFNSDLFAVNRDSMCQEVNVFIQSVINREITLHYDDKDWFAEVLCNCVYDGKKESIVVFLKPEKMEEYQYRWVVTGAKGRLLELAPSRRNHGLDILPNNHEVAFMALPKIHLLGNKNILNYAQDEFVVDPLTAFYTMIYSGSLKIETTEKIKYHFLKVPQYVFAVERFMRKGSNSGWLISELKFMSEDEKANYYKQLLSD